MKSRSFYKARKAKHLLFKSTNWWLPGSDLLRLWNLKLEAEIRFWFKRNDSVIGRHEATI